jgi:hypothetical protein
MVPGLVDVDETAIQVVVDFDCGGVVTVFPERSLPPFARRRGGVTAQGVRSCFLYQRLFANRLTVA